MSQDFQVRADNLDRIDPFDAGDPFLDVVLNILREIEDDARQLVITLRLNLVGQLVLGYPSWPLVKRLERCEQFDIREWRSIAAVIGPAMLRNHRDHFGVPQENFPHFSRGRFAVFQRKRGRHGSSNPKITFFQMRKKFTAESWRDEEKCSQR